MKYLILIASLIFVSSCKNSTSKDMSHKYTNALIKETSPYLLQHAHNPVDWFGWNPTTLQKAKDSQKLILISIGYAACHWCHVMEKETFEDSTAAAVMNTHFINIKVDREERPDVDQVYINAVQLMTGNAGWPLNVIALPDGRPIWGGTYFKKEDWLKNIQQIQTLYEEEPQRLEEYASKLEQGIKSMDMLVPNTQNVNFSEYEVKPLLDQWKNLFDTENGGYKGAPKFMMPSDLTYLLRMGVQLQDTVLLNHVYKSLNHMAFGGIYDPINGGFSRYSVDDRWHIPHFEKMLYDNAQLVSLYSQAYTLTKNTLYKTTIEETLNFINKELTHQDGMFYSSLDADSVTNEDTLEEGAYYIFSKETLQEKLGADFPLFETYYNVNNNGYWHEAQAYVLFRTVNDSAFCKTQQITLETLNTKKATWKNTLQALRATKVRPRLDTKSLTSWNALMLKGYVDAYKALRNTSYLESALSNAAFIRDHQLQDNGRLWHSYKDGKATINGYLEDYAHTINAFLALYEVTLDTQWLTQANALAEICFTDFYDTNSGMFYFTAHDEAELVSRTIEYRDNVIPSSNAALAHGLFVLSHHFDIPKYAETSQQMLKNVLPEMEKYPSAFSHWMQLLAQYQNAYYELVVVGPEALEKTTLLNSYYLPNKLLAGSTQKSDLYLLEGRYQKDNTYIYVCVNNTCKLPVKTVEEALKLINF